MLPDIELNPRPGVVEFGYGMPDPALLPGQLLAQAAAEVLTQRGHLALSYGAPQGAGSLIEHICARYAATEGHRPDPAQVLITGGISQGLDFCCTVLARPGDVALVETPIYHLGLNILRDHNLRLVPVPTDADGLLVDKVAATLARLRTAGTPARLLYTVPTFSNPTGLSLAADRRMALLELAERENVLLFEDDVYRDLWYDSPPPPALASLNPAAPVVRFGSFSKTLAPGLRLGWAVAAPELIQRCVGGGLLDSGGGQSQLAAQLMVFLLEQGLLEPHLTLLRNSYRQRRDALLDALATYMPAGCSWTTPGGGYFIWVTLPEGCDSAAMLPTAVAAGVAYVPGVRFFEGSGGARQLRLCFTLLPPEQIVVGVQRLAEVIGNA